MKIQLESAQETLPFLESISNSIATNQSLVVNAAMLKNISDSLDIYTEQLILDDSITYEESDLALFNELVDFCVVLEHNLNKEDHVNEFLIEIVDDMLNNFKTVRQYIIGCLGKDSYTYNSEKNLNKLINASNQMLDKHTLGQSVKFIQVA